MTVKGLDTGLIWQTVMRKNFWIKYSHLPNKGGWKLFFKVKIEVNYKFYFLDLYGLIYQVKQRIYSLENLYQIISYKVILHLWKVCLMCPLMYVGLFGFQVCISVQSHLFLLCNLSYYHYLLFLLFYHNKLT